jgi:DNA-binding GntR family transcriptional regulator
MAFPAKESSTMPYTKKQTIVDDVQAKIRSGEYPADHKLPSSRELQKIYACSAEPVRSAMEILKASGWLVGAPGLGVFVSTNHPDERAATMD